MLKEVIEMCPELKETNFAWRLGSGFAHGRPWAMLRGLPREVVEEDEFVAKFRMTNTFIGTEYFAAQALLVIKKLSDLRDLRAMRHVGGVRGD